VPDGTRAYNGQGIVILSFPWTAGLTIMQKTMRRRIYGHVRLAQIVVALTMMIFSSHETSQAQVPSDLKANLEPISAPDKKRSPKSQKTDAAPEVPPVCPSAHPTEEPPMPDSAHGHHSVTLTWIANPQPGNSAKPNVYYCLYRRKAEKAAPPKPVEGDISECKDCQLVTQVPIEKTGCLDTRVWDDSSYDYVVIAVAKNNKHSLASKPAHADVPSQDVPFHAPAVSYSDCWPQTNSINK